jgi:hypothetical protein
MFLFGWSRNAVIDNGIIDFAFRKLAPWIGCLLDRKYFVKKNRNSHGWNFLDPTIFISVGTRQTVLALVSFHIPYMVQPICCYRLLGKLSVIFTLFYNFCVEICNVTICTASVYSGGRGIWTCTWHRLSNFFLWFRGRMFRNTQNTSILFTWYPRFKLSHPMRHYTEP